MPEQLRVCLPIILRLFWRTSAWQWSRLGQPPTRPGGDGREVRRLGVCEMAGATAAKNKSRPAHSPPERRLWLAQYFCSGGWSYVALTTVARPPSNVAGRDC